MAFQPAALTERTLKGFVDRSLAHLKDHPKKLANRAGCQEMVARMLGFAHWHEAIAAARAPRAAVPSKRVHLGTYPAEPENWTQDHFRAFCLWAVAQGASAIHVMEGSRLMVKVAYGLERVTEGVVNADDVDQIQRVIQANLFTHHGVRFTVAGRGAEVAFRAHGNRVVQEGAIKRTLAIFLLGNLSESQLALPKASAFWASALPRRGIVLLIGEVGSGRTSLLHALLQRRVRQQTAPIQLVQEPIEWVYPQEEGQAPIRMVHPDALGQLRVSPLDVVALDEIRSSETIAHVAALAQEGAAVYAGLHGSGLTQGIGRLLGSLPEAQWRATARAMAEALSLVVHQRLNHQPEQTPGISRHLMIISPQARQALLSQINTATDRAELVAWIKEWVEAYAPSPSEYDH